MDKEKLFGELAKHAQSAKNVAHLYEVKNKDRGNIAAAVAAQVAAKAHKGAWLPWMSSLTRDERRMVEDRLKIAAVTFTKDEVTGLLRPGIPLEIYRQLTNIRYYELVKAFVTVIRSGHLGTFDPAKGFLTKATAAKTVALLKPVADAGKLSRYEQSAVETINHYANGTGKFTSREDAKAIDQAFDMVLAAVGSPSASISTVAEDEAGSEEYAGDVDDDDAAVLPDRRTELTTLIAELNNQIEAASSAKNWKLVGEINAQLEATQAELDVLLAEDTAILSDGQALLEAKRAELTTLIAELNNQIEAASSAKNWKLVGEINAQLEATQAELSDLDNPVVDTAPAVTTEPPSGPADPSASSGGGTTSSRTAARVSHAAGRRGKSASPANGGDGHPVTDPVERLAAHGLTEATEPLIVDMVRTGGNTKMVKQALDVFYRDQNAGLAQLRKIRAELDK